MKKEEFSEKELLEFAIYHDIIDKNSRIPGVKSNGYPDFDFFRNCSKIKKKDIEHVLNDWFESSMQSWWGGLGKNISILCSGGVDSSALVATINDFNVDYDLIHTLYLNHDNNDINKLKFLISQIPSKVSIRSLGENEYLYGIKLLIKNNSLQNTYGPTLMYTLNSLENESGNNIITGSGPDELFYGMEKYSFKYFNSLDELNIIKALKLIDNAYNKDSYLSVLNPLGLELFSSIKEDRLSLYKNISEINNSIFEAQRILAYLTVTTQHMKMFDDICNMNKASHCAPFIDPELIRICFSSSIYDLIDLSMGNENVEIGKKHLKKFLSRYLPLSHTESKKIGFHAPTTRFMYNSYFEKYFSSLGNKKIPSFIDRDKLNKILKIRFLPENRMKIIDYFLFSLYQIIELVQE